MDSFGSSSNGSAAAQPNPEAIMDQVKNQLAQAYAEEFLETVRGKCFEKCITKPGSSLSGSESSCISSLCIHDTLQPCGRKFCSNTQSGSFKMIVERIIEAHPNPVDEDTVEMARDVIEDWNSKIGL